MEPHAILELKQIATDQDNTTPLIAIGEEVLKGQVELSTFTWRQHEWVGIWIKVLLPFIDQGWWQAISNCDESLEKCDFMVHVNQTQVSIQGLVWSWRSGRWFNPGERLNPFQLLTSLKQCLEIASVCNFNVWILESWNTILGFVERKSQSINGE